MAWFHKSLKDLQEALERKEWKRVEQILSEHGVASEEAEKHLRQSWSSIKEYDETLSDMERAFKAYTKGTDPAKDEQVRSHMRVKIVRAIEAAHTFERMVRKTVEEGKLLD